ncbi:hypothetical protein EB796_002705 [Bugula neritina]|uniref:Uncharacterized protein n=1 Tax=Bugula neritina TaxID=10212 RepID=A0A7J7KKX6_BUGNE|nr:hypothetical protein EB796_002705 [Bugula neritina]
MKVIAILLSVCLALAAASLGAYAPRGSYNRPARYNNYNNNYNRPYSRGYSNTRRGGYNSYNRRGGYNSYNRRTSYSSYRKPSYSTLY